MHYSKKIDLKTLYFVHEFGTIFQGAQGQLIRIPSRPALFNAFRKTLKDRSRRDNSQMVKRAATRFVNEGNMSVITRQEKQFTEGLAKIEANSR